MLKTISYFLITYISLHCVVPNPRQDDVQNTGDALVPTIQSADCNIIFVELIEAPEATNKGCRRGGPNDKTWPVASGGQRQPTCIPCASLSASPFFWGCPVPMTRIYQIETFFVTEIEEIRFEAISSL